MSPRSGLGLLLLLCPLATVQAQVRLAELPALARARSERQRTSQEQALLPFWADLALDYRTNGTFLDQRIAKAAEFGDSAVPLLLEKLTPRDSSPGARNLASNCRRVLEHLDPVSFLDALIELADGTDVTARAEALRLLGHASSPRGVQFLVSRLKVAKGDDRVLILQSLRQQATPTAAPDVVPLLGSDERRVREAVLEYLIAARPAAVVPQVLEALSIEKDARLLPLFIDFLAATAVAHPLATAALLPLLDRDRLDWQDTVKLVQALATVAPKGHEATMHRLHEILDLEESGSLGLQAALALQGLGDRKGLERLHKSLNDHLRKPNRRRDPSLYMQRGDLFFAVEQWDKAKDDFDDAIRYSQSSSTIRRARLMMARCEAQRRRFTQVLELLQQAEPTYGDLLDLARTDAAMQEALQQEKIRSWLNTLKENEKNSRGG